MVRIFFDSAGREDIIRHPSLLNIAPYLGLKINHLDLPSFQAPTSASYPMNSQLERGRSGLYTPVVPQPWNLPTETATRTLERFLVVVVLEVYGFGPVVLLCGTRDMTPLWAMAHLPELAGAIGLNGEMVRDLAATAELIYDQRKMWVSLLNECNHINLDNRTSDRQLRGLLRSESSLGGHLLKST